VGNATPAAERGTPLGRRIFIGLVGFGAAGIFVGDKVQSFVGGALHGVVNENGSGLGALIPGADRFRLYTVTPGFPDIPNKQYRLYVGGLVGRQLTLTVNDLRAMPATHLTKDFQCVTGWRVPAVPWIGVRLSDLIDKAGVLPGATGVEFTSYDGVYTESLTMDEARRSDVVVAYDMLGAPVSSVHGGPVRLYVAPMYGYKSIKWLRSISLVRQTVPGFWEQQGYDVEGWIGESNGNSSDAPVDGR
jgi:DMSO/TMAO reductase YedYZ molybdopterin-dependent catalytic subunit